MDSLQETRSERVDLRMTPSAKRTLLQAAAVQQKTLTEFLLDRGLQAAFETLAGRTTFVLDQARWDAFNEALDQPPGNNAALRTLLARRPVWES
jgi:uncharacterized protein (DUF1778 family)